MHEPVIFIEPIELYNLLNQVYLDVPIVVQEYGMVLFDTRKPEEYNESHIITAKHVSYNETEGYLVPKNIDYTAVEHIVIIDNNTTSLKDILSTGIACAKMLYKMGSKYAVKIVRGGYEQFSALYPFLRSTKILYTQNEKYLIKMYPIEIEPKFLYNGTHEQAGDALVAKHLKVKAHVNATIKSDSRFTPDDMVSGKGDLVCQVLNIPIEDDIKADIYQYFPVVCSFITQHKKNDGKSVLIYSDCGRSRSTTLVMAYMMQSMKIPLKDALSTMVRHHQSIRPNRSFIKSLMKWEVEVLGSEVTKAAELGYLSYD